MSQTLIFNMFLINRMAEVGVDQLDLARELGYRTLVKTSQWCRGDGLPPSYMLPGIAVVLKVRPVELAVIWLMSKVPEFEQVFRKEVLEPRGVDLPRQL